MNFRERYGPWALIAGASEGIGAAFAHALAGRGLHLVLLARRAGPLEALATGLRAAHGVEVRTASVDLAASPAELEACLEDVTAGLTVGLVIANAALSLTADFTELGWAEVERSLDLNVRAPLKLAHHFVPQWKARGRGGLVWMSSLAGLTGGPRVATYTGSKGFAFAFAESLWRELQHHGVDVLVVGAGPTHTPTYDAVGPPSFPPVMHAGAVVEAALDGLGRGPRVIPGWFNRAVALLMRALPRRWALAMVDAQTRRFAARRQ